MALLDNGLITVTALLNDHLRGLHPSSQDWVVRSDRTAPGGTPLPSTKDRIVATVVNLTRETTITTYEATRPTKGQFVAAGPPLYIDMTVVFTASFSGDTYDEGLAILSDTIAFFQANPVFTRESAPDLDPAIDKLQAEIETLDIPTWAAVTAMQNAPYLPSICIKFRMFPFQSDAVAGPIPTVRAVEP